MAASDLFEPGALAMLDPAEAAARLGEDAAPALLLGGYALVIEPAVAGGTGRLQVEVAAVTEVEQTGSSGACLDPTGR